MKDRHTLSGVIVLALISAAAILGLLLADGVADWILLVLAALPLLVGLWCWWVQAARAIRR
jgi:hypothetical protein